MPNIPYQTYTREQWQQIMTNAAHAHDLNAVRDAANALNQYSQESLQAGQMSSIPGELGAVAKGIGQGVMAIPGGLKGLASQIGQGDIGGAAKSFVGGLGQTGKNIAGAVEVGADALANAGPMDEVMPESQRLQKLQGAGSALPGLGLARVAEPMVKGAIGKVMSPITGTMGNIGKLLQSIANKAPGEAEGAAEGAAEAAEQGAAGASPAGSPRPTVRGGGTATPGYEGQPKGIDVTGVGPAAGKASTAPTLGDYTGANALQSVADAIRQQRPGIASLDEMVQRNAQPPQMDTGNLTNQPPQFEEGLPAARTSTMPRATNADIDAYLRRIAQASAQGYK